MTRREQMIECAEQMELLMGITNYYVACWWETDNDFCSYGEKIDT